MAVAGLPDLNNSDRSEQFVDRFRADLEVISAIYLKYLLLGCLRFGRKRVADRTVRTFIKKRSDLINNPGNLESNSTICSNLNERPLQS